MRLETSRVQWVFQSPSLGNWLRLLPSRSRTQGRSHVPADYQQLLTIKPGFASDMVFIEVRHARVIPLAVLVAIDCDRACQLFFGHYAFLCAIAADFEGGGNSCARPTFPSTVVHGSAKVVHLISNVAFDSFRQMNWAPARLGSGS
jgi:hypothetical protein